MIYLKAVIELIKQIIISILKLILSITDDLQSFRNKLVLFTCFLVFIIIWKDKDYRISLAALGLLEFFLCYYFNNRKVKDASKIKTVVKEIIKKD